MAKKTETSTTQSNETTNTTDRTNTELTATATQLVSSVSMFDDDIAQYAGAGTSDRREDNVVPFLKLLQKGSPEVNKKDPGYVQGAEAGMFINTATRTLYPAEEPGAGPLAVQAHMEVREVQWWPRNSSGGKGYVASHPLDTPLLKNVKEVENPQNPGAKRKIRMLPDGTQLVTTAYHYMVLADTLEFVVVGLTSTGLQTHRNWNTMLRNKKIKTATGPQIRPAFQTLVRLRSFWQQNEAGDWYSVAVDDIGLVTENYLDAYHEAKKFFQLALTEGLKTEEPPTEETKSPTIDGDAPIEDDMPL